MFFFSPSLVALAAFFLPILVMDATPFPNLSCNSNRIGLKTWRGTYVSARDDGSVKQVASLDSWETFDIIPGPDDKIALKTWRGTYISARNSDEADIVKQMPWNREWENFCPEDDGQGGTSFLTWRNTYVSARNTDEGDIVKEMPWDKQWETFSIVCVGL